ncbi:hypothetical protein LTR62_000164 [Meristemomyces frigidus]|uniref:AMP-dependent synthetase/ligase domain-containing protein n=1 Tax=Meristemomyces frigidus TaxID=1508187 RepID=A0AAN7TR33_9PEZI|nr:hypothetical protein LTR62_000164 [Meristemomyces frigidus]
MPLLAPEHTDIPTKDILSWRHDNRSTFDQDKPIFIDAAHPQHSISANQAYPLIRKLIAVFRHLGLQKDDCVCIHSCNSVHYPILVLGIIGAGGVFFGTNPAYTSYELQHALQTSKAKFVITEEALPPALRKPVAQLGIQDKCVLFADQADVAFRPGKGRQSWRSLLQHGEEDSSIMSITESQQQCASRAQMLTLRGPRSRGAAPLDVETPKSFQALLSPEAKFAQIWALTETSCLASIFYHPEGDETGSVGRFIPNLDVKIVDDEDLEETVEGAGQSWVWQDRSGENVASPIERNVSMSLSYRAFIMPADRLERRAQLSVAPDVPDLLGLAHAQVFVRPASTRSLACHSPS